MVRRGFSNWRCPRCNGNIFLEGNGIDSIGKQSVDWIAWCLQCGYTLYLKADTDISDKSETSVGDKV
jgi:predicted nucleic-acid-binding Zn-ribbon protein